MGCGFDFEIKVEALSKPKSKNIRSVLHPDERLFQNIVSDFEKLKANAGAGSEKAREHLNWLRWSIWREFQKYIEEEARAGRKGFPPPIRTLFEMADFVVPLLLWLSEHQKGNIKQYARLRWAWPGFFHLSKREQKKYQDLLPVFDKAGKKILDGPVELGKGLGLSLNANLTKGDHLFILAANVVHEICKIRDLTQWPNASLSFLMQVLNVTVASPRNRRFHADIERYVLSLGELSQGNWAKWKPLFETYLTISFAPGKIKLRAVPVRLHLTLETQDFISHFRPLQESGAKEIRKVVDLKKTESGKWNALKNEILKRIKKLIPSL